MNPVRLWVCENAVLAGGGEPSIVPLSVDRTAQFTKSCLDGRQLRLDARLVQLVHEGRAGVRRRRETEKNMSRRRRRARKAKRHPNPTMTFANRTLSWRRQGQSPREIKTTRAFGCGGRGSPWQSDDRTEAESAGGGKRRQRFASTQKRSRWPLRGPSQKGSVHRVSPRFASRLRCRDGSARFNL
jgi:hypothetical protein